MGDRDDTPKLGNRAGTVDRDLLVPKHLPTRKSNPRGYPVYPGVPQEITFEHTPPPVALPEMEPTDSIAEAALHIQRRSETIARRPGVTPTASSLTVALTLAGVQSELTKQIAAMEIRLAELITGVKNRVDEAVLDELKADRRMARDEKAQEIVDKAAWSKLVRDVTYRVVGGIAALGTLVYAILKATHVL